jgi:hypothetical protein
MFACRFSFAVVLLIGTIGVAADPAPSTQELTAEELNTFWSDLAGGDAKKGWVAINTLARHPKQSVPLFKERLRPIQAVEEARLKELIKNLDSPKFGERTRAEAELEKMQELAKPAMEAALAAKPPLEVAKRIDGLLAKLGGTLSAGEKLRSIRALESLEMIGTPDAAEVLKTIAGGAPEARVTEDARASLERLARSLSRKP